jgi:ectoine hydroxylase-related dioxygenase (phytanoyl-CoA dioxygenase family)
LVTVAQTVDEHISRINDVGYTVVEGVASSEFLDGLIDDLDRLERDLQIVPADNSFEGRRTTRIYNLLAHGLRFEQIPVHDDVLPICEGVLDRGLLISSLSSIAIGPDEVAQPIHADDQLIPIDKPHAPLICNTMWALTDFTEENGATRVIPGSHLASSSPEYGTAYESVSAEMSRGSVLVWHGSLWHGGGANRTGQRRIGIAMNYCAGYIRQQENQQLGLPAATVRGFSPRLRELVGLTVYRGLIGHIDKKSPDEYLLGDGSPHSMLWDYSR